MAIIQVEDLQKHYQVAERELLEWYLPLHSLQRVIFGFVFLLP